MQEQSMSEQSIDASTPIATTLPNNDQQDFQRLMNRWQLQKATVFSSRLKFMRQVSSQSGPTNSMRALAKQNWLLKYQPLIDQLNQMLSASEEQNKYKIYQVLRDIHEKLNNSFQASVYFYQLFKNNVPPSPNHSPPTQKQLSEQEQEFFRLHKKLLGDIDKSCKIVGSQFIRETQGYFLYLKSKVDETKKRGQASSRVLKKLEQLKHMFVSLLFLDQKITMKISQKVTPQLSQSKAIEQIAECIKLRKLQQKFIEELLLIYTNVDSVLGSVLMRLYTSVHYQSKDNCLVENVANILNLNAQNMVFRVIASVLFIRLEEVAVAEDLISECLIVVGKPNLKEYLYRDIVSLFHRQTSLLIIFPDSFRIKLNFLCAVAASVVSDGQFYLQAVGNMLGQLIDHNTKSFSPIKLKELLKICTESPTLPFICVIKDILTMYRQKYPESQQQGVIQLKTMVSTLSRTEYFRQLIDPIIDQALLKEAEELRKVYQVIEILEMPVNEIALQPKFIQTVIPFLKSKRVNKHSLKLAEVYATRSQCEDLKKIKAQQNLIKANLSSLMKNLKKSTKDAASFILSMFITAPTECVTPLSLYLAQLTCDSVVNELALKMVFPPQTTEEEQKNRGILCLFLIEKLAKQAKANLTAELYQRYSLFRSQNMRSESELIALLSQIERSSQWRLEKFLSLFLGLVSQIPQQKLAVVLSQQYGEQSGQSEEDSYADINSEFAQSSEMSSQQRNRLLKRYEFIKTTSQTDLFKITVRMSESKINPNTRKELVDKQQLQLLQSMRFDSTFRLINFTASCKDYHLPFVSKYFIDKYHKNPQLQSKFQQKNDDQELSNQPINSSTKMQGSSDQVDFFFESSVSKEQELCKEPPIQVNLESYNNEDEDIEKYFPSDSQQSAEYDPDETSRESSANSANEQFNGLEAGKSISHSEPEENRFIGEQSVKRGTSSQSKAIQLLQDSSESVQVIPVKVKVKSQSVSAQILIQQYSSKEVKRRNSGQQETLEGIKDSQAQSLQSGQESFGFAVEEGSEQLSSGGSHDEVRAQLMQQEESIIEDQMPYECFESQFQSDLNQLSGPNQHTTHPSEQLLPLKKNYEDLGDFVKNYDKSKFNYISSFNAVVRKGIPITQNQIRSSRDQLFSCLVCLSYGLANYQQMGIMQQDLSIPNVIKQKHSEYIYSIIDLDCATKVGYFLFSNESQAFLSYLATQKHMTLWLAFNHQKFETQIQNIIKIQVESSSESPQEHELKLSLAILEDLFDTTGRLHYDQFVLNKLKSLRCQSLFINPSLLRQDVKTPFSKQKIKEWEPQFVSRLSRDVINQVLSLLRTQMYRRHTQQFSHFVRNFINHNDTRLSKEDKESVEAAVVEHQEVNVESKQDHAVRFYYLADKLFKIWGNQAGEKEIQDRFLGSIPL